MSDEIIEHMQAEVPGETGRRPDPHLLAYDFFKHMTSLSVLTLGGMLTLSGSIFAAVATTEKAVIAMALIAGSGVIAFAGQVEMVDWAHRGSRRPRISARWGRGLVALLYGAGVGAFLSVAHGALQ